MTLDYFGVKNAQGGNLQLIVVVSDEDGSNLRKWVLPPDGVASVGNFEVKKLDQRVFHTESAKGNLKISILAYHRDQTKAVNLALIGMMEWYYGDSISFLKNIVLNMPVNDKLIGWYENEWYPDEKWGIGQYKEVGSDDLKVWFSIWSDAAPPPISPPTLKPDVRIESVKLGGADPPWQAKKNQGIFQEFAYPQYSVLITVVNNESVDLTVDWAGLSDTKEGFGSGSITVPKNSRKTGTATVYFSSSGQFKITYSVSRGGAVLDTWSGMVNVIP